MRKRWVLGGLVASMVAALALAACSAGSPSEQVVRRNLPAEKGVAPSAPGAGVSAALADNAVKRAALPASDKAITSQEVERELNRLEAELR